MPVLETLGAALGAAATLKQLVTKNWDGRRLSIPNVQWEYRRGDQALWCAFQAINTGDKEVFVESVYLAVSDVLDVMISPLNHLTPRWTTFFTRETESYQYESLVSKVQRAGNLPFPEAPLRIGVGETFCFAMALSEFFLPWMLEKKDRQGKGYFVVMREIYGGQFKSPLMVGSKFDDLFKDSETDFRFASFY